MEDVDCAITEDLACRGIEPTTPTPGWDPDLNVYSATDRSS